VASLMGRKNGVEPERVAGSMSVSWNGTPAKMDDTPVVSLKWLLPVYRGRPRARME
jgi:hypothetical protein